MPPFAFRRSPLRRIDWLHLAAYVGWMLSIAVVIIIVIMAFTH